MYYIVGLGNPGEEYKLSRHNTGRIIVEDFKKSEGLDDFEFDKKINALVSEGNPPAGGGKEKVILILPETFMNKSGSSLKNLITSKKKAENLVVIHDDVDLPLGKFKIKFGSGSAGHKGVESIMRMIKTKEFIRIKVGVSPTTPSGKIKKPESKKMGDFILRNFSPKEQAVIKKESKKITSALEAIIGKGLGKAMNLFN
ncbi:MAG: aminoacyl-tRNA hydrolase [Candidatus Paceibacterota bacterium]